MRKRLLLGSALFFASFWIACGGNGTDEGGLQSSNGLGAGAGTGVGGSAHSGSGGTTGKGGSSAAMGGATGKGGGLLGQGGGANPGAGGASGNGTGGSIGLAGSSNGGSAGSTSAGGSGGALMCAPGTADCNGLASDKCESHTDNDASNCGSCGHKCAAGANSTASCVASVCSTACQSGYTDCDGDPSNGCETSTFNDPLNCGTCKNACPAGMNVPASCAVGMCGLVCASGTGDCNKMVSDGCEAMLDTDPHNCGQCGTDCGTGACVMGACSCAGETQKAQKIPLDMYIMMDQSASMSDTVANGDTKWDAVTMAFTAFFNDPGSVGLGVGIQYFALTMGGSTIPTTCTKKADCIVGGVNYGPCFLGMCLGGATGSDSCSATDYATPEVEIADLPGSAAALQASIGKHSPSTDTPTAPALQGAIQHAQAWQTAHPDHVVIAVLATDGDPTECDPTDIPSIAAIAAAGVSGTPSIKTFVIGVGTETANLNALAVGGGTTSAFVVDTSMDVVMQFEKALQAIQGSALGCQYSIPAPAMGMIDPNKVNVEYTPGNGMSPEALSQVANMAACGAAGGWYYDVPAAPTKILLCPATCTVVSGDQSGSVDVQLGCATRKD